MALLRAPWTTVGVALVFAIGVMGISAEEVTKGGSGTRSQFTARIKPPNRTMSKFQLCDATQEWLHQHCAMDSPMEPEVTKITVSSREMPVLLFTSRSHEKEALPHIIDPAGMLLLPTSTLRVLLEVKKNCAGRRVCRLRSQ